MRRYLIHFILAAFTFALLMLGFNWVVDPYAIFHTVHEKNSAQPLRVMNERIFKTVNLAHQPSDVVFFGTSRTDIGIGATHPFFRDKQVVNLATFGQPIYESHRLMRLVAQYAKPKVIVVGLDFFAFNALFPRPTDFTEANFEASRRVNLAFSISTSVDAWKALRNKKLESGDCCDANGFRTLQDYQSFVGHYRQRFASNERTYLMEKYQPFPSCRFTYQNNNGQKGSTLDELRAIIQLGHQHHIEVHFFISPAHARQWETLAVAGLWTQWEDWKRQVVQINSEEAHRVGRAEFALWDFSGYGKINSEVVPPAGSPVLMRWYTDSAHFTPAAGAHVLSRLFDTQPSESFGVRLTSATLDAHLAALRVARHGYQVAHPEEVAEIAALAHEVNLTKHCAKNQ